MKFPAYNTAEIIQKELDYLKQALALANETRAADVLYKIHKACYIVYKELGQYDKALEHFEFFNSFEKEIHSNSINQKILNLEITHRVEKSMQEAEIYRLRNIELAELRLAGL